VEQVQIKGENMSSESKAFMKELHSLINSEIDVYMDVFFGTEYTPSNLLGGNLIEKDIATLRTIKISEDQKSALRKYIIAVSRSSALCVLSLIDGIVMTDEEDMPDLTLVDRKTGKDISDESFLNEEFYELM
jgi:hypothetical protein